LYRWIDVANKRSIKLCHIFGAMGLRWLGFEHPGLGAQAPDAGCCW